MKSKHVYVWINTNTWAVPLFISNFYGSKFIHIFCVVIKIKPKTTILKGVNPYGKENIKTGI